MDSAGDPLEEPAGSDLGRRIVRPLWQEVQEEMMRRLDEITVDELCRRAQEAGLARDAETTIDFSI